MKYECRNIGKSKARLLLILAIGLVSISSFAQEAKGKGSSFKIGVKGGMSFTSISYNKPGNISETMNSHSSFNVGLAFKIKLPVRGLVLQPEIAYISKGATFRGDADLNVRMGYVEVPLNIQYGIDLVFFKPFLEISPFIGYAVNKEWESESLLQDVTWSDLNRFGYGLGVGLGLDIWRFQVKVKYNWSFGRLTNIEIQGAVDENVGLLIEQINQANFRGLEVSLAFFF